MKRRPMLCLCALALTAGLVYLLAASTWQTPPALTDQQGRQLLRIWSVSGIGGSEAWLKKQLQQFEKRNPGLMTYLRTVTPGEVLAEDAVLPDLILYTPGSLQNPQDVFVPLSVSDQLREPLLRCGRWQGQQYALPLCWGGYVLCVNSAYDDLPPDTPVPTTLLGRPAATPAVSVEPPAFPYASVQKAQLPLLSPSGCGVFTLCCLLEPSTRPALKEGLWSAADVYGQFRSQGCAAAVLTTGQLTAFSSLTAAGKGFPCRVMTPQEIITDQVLLGSIVRGAENSAAPQLLAFLISQDAQQALTTQNLHTARSDLTLYASGPEGRVESAARRSLTAVNAFVPSAGINTAAWQAYTGTLGLSEALLPLL